MVALPSSHFERVGRKSRISRRAPRTTGTRCWTTLLSPCCVHSSHCAHDPSVYLLGSMRCETPIFSRNVHTILQQRSTAVVLSLHLTTAPCVLFLLHRFLFFFLVVDRTHQQGRFIGNGMFHLNLSLAQAYWYMVPEDAITLV